MRKCLIAGLLLLCAASGRADIKYTQTTTIGEGATDSAMAAPATHTLKAVRDGAERSEMTMKMGPLEMNNVSIQFCDPERTVRLDDGLKIYCEEFSNQTVETGDNNQPEESTPPKQGKDETGKIVATYNVQDLGVEKVADWSTHHYKFHIKMVFSGCVGNRTTDMIFENWIADVKDAHPCKKINPIPEMSKQMPNMKQPHHNNCHFTIETKGNFADFGKAMSGLVMRSKMYSDGKLLSTTEVTSLSQAKLGDELFTIPVDYKKVSPKEFDKAQQQAMMKKVMGGAAFKMPKF